MSLSVGLQLTGVDDYIQSNVNCILPVQDKPQKPQKGLAKISIGDEPEDLQHQYTEQSTQKLTKVVVRLEDCLACSGCVTSAETVLIEQQGLPEFRKQVQQCKSSETQKRIICTIADEVIASMCAVHEQSFQMVWTRIENFLRSEGVDEVCDLSLAQDISLYAIYDEWKQYEQMNRTLLTSTCPGWVCYAEKNKGKEMFPFMSTVCSSMTIAGMMMKQNNRNIYHVSLQMCYDKKLEATKTYNDVHVVDCVLSTNEIDALIDWNAPIASFTTNRTVGFVSSPARFIAQRENKGIEFKQTKNKDYYENDGIIIATGFRNIQNVVRNVLTQQKYQQMTKKTQFIEIEACPGGCICGGGQIKCLPKEREERMKKMNAVLQIKVVDEKNYEIYQQWKNIIHMELIDRKEKTEQSALQLNW